MGAAQLRRLPAAARRRIAKVFVERRQKGSGISWGNEKRANAETSERGDDFTYKWRRKATATHPRPFERLGLDPRGSNATRGGGHRENDRKIKVKKKKKKKKKKK